MSHSYITVNLSHNNLYIFEWYSQVQVPMNSLVIHYFQIICIDIQTIRIRLILLKKNFGLKKNHS